MHRLSQSVDNTTSPVLPLWLGGNPNMKSKLIDFQQSVGIGNGFIGALLEGAVYGLRHPRTPVSFVRSPSLSGGGPLTSLGANAKKGQGCPSDTASSVVVTTPKIL